MDKNLILAIDQGTHASKALLFDQDGRVVKSAIRDIGILRGKNGVVEQDPEEIAGSVFEVVEEVLASAQGQVRCAGLAVQRSTMVAWDVNIKKALAPAISWQDTRTGPDLDVYCSSAGLIHNRTGLRLSPHYGAPKLAWLLKNSPETASAAKRNALALGPVSSWILFRLLENNPLIVDHCCASRTLLWNLRTLDWDDELLKLFGIPKRFLPKCMPVRSSYGNIKKFSIPLTAVNGDQGAALFCRNSPEAGIAYVNIGTGAFVLAPVGSAPKLHTRLLTGPIDSSFDEAAFVLEGTVNGAGSAISLFRKKLNHSCGNKGEASGGMPVFVNTVGGLGSPWWISGIEPFFIMDENKSQNRLTAVEESIVFMLKANLDQMREAGLEFKQIRASGGLSRSDDLCRKLSALTGLPVSRSSQPEATAAGIARLAGGIEKKWPIIEDKLFMQKHDSELAARFQLFIKAVERLNSE